jgi:hypothetical protein
MSRHGLDLLAVKFNENPNLDEVNFWEAKATGGDISWCRDEIINWFNIEFGSRVNMAIEAAKNEWRYLYPPHICRRACSALCRYQATETNHRFIGSIAHDYNSYPGVEDLKKFKLINGPANQKQVVLFSIRNLTATANEVFMLACLT